MSLLMSAFLILVVLGLIESAVLQARVRRIPIRIHVNGTRGKSSVTRLIAAGLRAGGHRVVAKTTGTLPRLILEDGGEVPLARRGRATIREQMRVLSLAAKRKADAVVLECMAIHPELQWVSEHRMVRSTIGVITNVREDHQEVLGFDHGRAARALAATIPVRGLLVMGEAVDEPLFRETARRRGTRVEVVDRCADAWTSPDRLEPAENVEVALRVCEAVGVSRERALAGMKAAIPDAGALRVLPSRLGMARITFINAFSLNDVDSLRVVWRSLAERGLATDPLVVLLNGREDRPLRSRRFGGVVGAELAPERLLLAGGGWRFARREAVRAGYPADRIVHLSGKTAEEIGGQLCEHVPPDSTLLGLGNYQGVGRAIAEHLERHGDVR